MLLLNWTERLKELIGEIETTGGDPYQKSTAPATLVADLKRYFLSQMEGLSKTDANAVRDLRGFFTEQITEGFFENGVRLCIIELAQFGVAEHAKMQTLLQTVINRFIEQFIRRRPFEVGPVNDMQDLLAQHLLEVWENLGSETSRVYDFARQRLLISWDYTKKRWRATSLGKAMLELSPLQAICFLLTIDLMNSTGFRDFRYISRDLLESVLQQSPPKHVVPLHLTTLEEIGVLTRGRPFEWDSYQTTPVGKLAIERVLFSPNPMIDFIETLTNAEEQGIALSNFYEEVERVRSVLDSPIVDPSTRDSISTALTLHDDKHYLEAVRILYPSIEAIANSMLLSSGDDPGDRKLFPGLARKLARLEESGLIRSDLAKSIDITTARNKTLHGEFTPSDQEYAFPLCFTALFYLRRMIEGYNELRSY